MRFVKLTDTKLGKDMVHVWIEDDCDEMLQRLLIGLLNNEVRIWDDRFTVTDKLYDKRESKGKQ